MMKRIISCLLIVAFLTLPGCSKSEPINNSSSSIQAIDNKNIPSVQERFTDLNSISYSNPELMDDLKNVENINDVQYIELLKEYYFYTVPSEYNEFYRLYEAGGDYPVFISTDVTAHMYHVLFDYYLKSVEESGLYGICRSLSSRMLKQSIDVYNSIDETNTKNAALKNVAYFAVADYLAGNNTNGIPDEARDLAQKEIKLIEDACGKTQSAIFPYQIDYSQFIPRGHYTRSDELEKYFKAMMWLGNVPLPFERQSNGTTVRCDEQIIQSLLMTDTLFSGDASGDWDKLYNTTSFLVGESDDLTPYEYRDIMTKVYGQKPDLNVLWQEDKLSSVLEESKKARQPLIGATMEGTIGSVKNVDGKMIITAPQFRFMGQRYIMDSEVFYNLTYVEPGRAYRPFPKGLDFPSALGSSRAYDILTNSYKEQEKWSGYIPAMDTMKYKISSADQEVWTRKNLYNAWIWMDESIIDVNKNSYPITLNTGYWQDKGLNTFLGNWSEMRHDTLLYAKQSEPVCGSAMPKVEYLSYVEPNVTFYERMDYLLQWMKEGLQNSKLVKDESLSIIQDFRNEVQFLRDMSLKEIKGQELGEEEYMRIKNYGYTMESLFRRLAGGDTRQFEILEDEGMAVIADIHNYDGQSLEVGVGNPDEIYVIVPIAGKWYVARGGVYSYYEFLQPSANRLTDEQWKAMVNGGNLPGREKWIEPYMAN